jgi:hypothetical protein
MRINKTIGMASALAIGLGLVVVPTATRADTFNLTSCDLSTGCGTATLPFGTVTLTTTTAGVLFDVVLTSGNRFVETGAGNQELFLFNDSVSGSTITNITATLNGTVVAIPGGLSGFTNLLLPKNPTTGDLTGSVECTDPKSCNGASGPNINDLHFTVTGATLAQLETKNTNGNIFIADILCGQTGCGGLTGLVDVSTGPIPPPVPIPPAAMLFGSALVGLGLLGRRRRKGGLAQA